MVTRLREELVPWDSQPQELVTANPDFSEGLLRLFNLADTSDVVSRSGLSSSSNPLMVSNPVGRGVALDHTQPRNYNWGNGRLAEITDQATVLFYGSLNSITDTGDLLGITNGSWGMIYLSTQWNTKKVFVSCRTSAGVLDVFGTSNRESSAPCLIVGTYDGANVRLYVNGVIEGSTSRSGNLLQDGSNAYNLLAEKVVGVANIGAFWKRALSPAEVLALSANPWQLFAPRINQIPVYASAGVGTIYYVIGPDAGWTDPTAAEIMAGQLAGGTPATSSGSEVSPSVTTAPFTFSADATGLSASTAYRVAYVWSDA